MNLLILITIFYIINIGASILLYEWYDKTDKITKISHLKNWNIVFFMITMLITVGLAQIMFNLNGKESLMVLLCLFCIRLSALYYFPFNAVAKLPNNGIDDFNLDSYWYNKLIRPEKTGAMIRNIVVVWRWILFISSLVILFSYF